MDNLDFLDAGEPAKGDVQPTQVETPAAEPVAAEPTAETPAPTEGDKPERPRGPDGKFAKKEADEPVMVPLKALHETRDELKALKAELDRLNAPKTQEQQQVAPDIFEDPEGYRTYQKTELQRAVLNVTLNLSEEMATQQHGAETIEQAKQWATSAFQSNPALYQQFISQRNPYGFLVSEYQRQSLLSQLGENPDEIKAYLAWKQAQSAPTAAPAAQTQPIERPTSSIATATSAGGVQHIATGPGVAFDNLIRN